MTTPFAISGSIKGLLAALTPLERFNAIRNLHGDFFMIDHVFILTGVTAIIVLTILFFAIGRHRARQEKKTSEKLFAEFAERRGLTDSESRALLDIACKAGLNRAESIFTLDEVFNRTVAGMIEEKSSNQKTAKESELLKTELYYLGEKLGFGKPKLVPVGLSLKSTLLSSRQIAEGKKVYVSCKQKRDLGEVEATVVKNSDDEFVVRLARSIIITFGDFWCVRYYFGPSVWEFDTSVISYDGGVLALNQSDNVKYVNRRRFLRVPVRKQAFIAEFPFERSLEIEHGTFGVSLQPPKFVPAVVTELGGPGLRIESSQQMKVGQRVLVAFNLAQEDSESDSSHNDTAAGIVEDIGEVRNIRPSENGSSMAVELTGLNDSNIAELIRIANAALVRRNKITKELSTSNLEAVLEKTSV